MGQFMMNCIFDEQDFWKNNAVVLTSFTYNSKSKQEVRGYA